MKGLWTPNLKEQEQIPQKYWQTAMQRFAVRVASNGICPPKK